MSGPPPVRLYTPSLSVPLLQGPTPARDLFTPQIAGAVDKYQAALDEKSKTDATIYSAQQLATLREAYTTQVINARANGTADNGFTGQTLDQFNADAKAAIDNAPNTDAQDQLNVALPSLHNEVHSWAMNAELDGLQAGRLVDTQNIINTNANTVRLHPDQFGEIMPQLDAQIRATTLLGDKRPALIAQAGDQLAEQYVYGLAAQPGGYKAAQEALASGKLSPFLHPDRVTAIQTHLLEEQNKAQLNSYLGYEADLARHRALTSAPGAPMTPPPPPPPATELGDAYGAHAQIAYENQITQEETARNAQNKDLQAFFAGVQSRGAADKTIPEERKGANLWYENTGPPTVPVAGLPQRKVDIQNAIAGKAQELAGAQPDGVLHESDNQQLSDMELALKLGAVVKLGFVPDDMKADVNVPLRNGTPEQQGRAALLYTQILTANPRYKEDFNAETVTAANGIMQRINNGMLPADAASDYQSWLKIKNTAGAPATELMQGSYRTATKPAAVGGPDANEAFLRNVYGASWFDFWTTSPELRPAFLAAFGSAVHNEYMGGAHQDLGLAQKNALDHIQQRWGISYVNGGVPRMAIDAPETHYGLPSYSPADNAAWIKDQAERQFQAGTVEPLSFYKDHVEIHPLPDGGNYHTNDGRPAYALEFIDPNGVGTFLKKADGSIQPWWPNDAAEQGRVNAMKAAAWTAKLNSLRAKPVDLPPSAFLQ